MPPIWKGAIRFGLVNIPVALLTAESRDELDFDLLDRRDLSPVGYQTVNKRTGRRVERSEVVKGYEVAAGQYVTVSDADFKRAAVEASQSIDIVEFVTRDEIDLRYYDRPYFVTPLPKAAHAYALLRDTLAETGRLGVARVVLRTREHLAALFPLDEVLVCNLLRFAHELRRPPKVEAGGKAAKGEREMARMLVESMSARWEPEELTDTYRRHLVALLEKKRAAGGTLPPQPRSRAPKPDNVVDLVTLLRRSVEEGGQGRGVRPQRRRAAARRPAAGRRKTAARAARRGAR